MKNRYFGSERLLLLYAKQFTTLVAAYRGSDLNMQSRLHLKMSHILELSGKAMTAAKRRCECRLEYDIRDFVVHRRPFERPIASHEAEAVRRYYATPSVYHLVASSGFELSGLADLLEGWAQDKRLDCRSMIELLGWSEGMRSLVDAVGLDYTALPWPQGPKPPLFKFLATKILRR
ncbi:hypothetical protein LRP30_09180 [Bradyrhizobium sp. C-145]|uniref:hypothetical protein n=1 Tax=Bradyrhizobium sp. C-145 TaxID=574727 RepID=UPI00201B789C|nr:hypothetical protein [Bradyrhizobium sp. C-145]UQR65396.1 hypothetical protein LRP30_09180 [Bradyrhizobium sp. C-145]